MEKKRRWGPEQRLEFIEFMLHWGGGINRSDLTERFGVSVPQASSDLTAYKELAPENLDYDSSAKRYVPSRTFRPRLLKPNPDRYLAQLKALSDGIIDLRDTWLPEVPPTGVLPVPSRPIDAQVLRALLTAVREKSAIEIEYQSTSPDSPDPSRRWITPHAFGFDGLRWHVRAFCHRNAGFKDFILGRCKAPGDTRPGATRAEEDWQWHTFFEVVLQPNPALTASQRAAVAADYGMTNAKVTVPVRYALLYYFNKRLRLDVAARFDQPRERPVVVANHKEFSAALVKAGAEASEPDERAD